MEERKYRILMSTEFVNNEAVAETMDLTTATTLLEALFDKYYNEDPLMISIVRMEQSEVG